MLVNWIIFNTRPLSIVQSESFQKFIKELDPAFTVPDTKLVKQTIQKAYIHTFPLIQKFVEDNAISVSLTTDMWTGRNRQGFLGVTCFFLDRNFTIHEVILTIEYIRYSNIKWQPCAAHTLQLVVGKGLSSIKLLVLRVKRLIDFFLRPKQSERLENIQKKSQNQIDVVSVLIYNL